MADEPLVVRGIDWKATFPFVSLFRGFRVAIHPSKLILALVALMLIYFGGKVLDGIWPRDYRAVPAELEILVTEVGMTPLQAITSATGAAARILGVHAAVGTLEKGRYADLLAVSGDPSVRIQDLRSPKVVLKGGRMVAKNGIVLV